MSVARKRRAIYTVLSDIVDEPELWQVMWCWQNKYSDKSQFELNEFLSTCDYIESIANNRSFLYRQLIRAMMLPKSELKSDPLVAMQRYQNEYSDDLNISASKKDDWSEVFTRIITVLFSQLREDTATQVAKYASEQALRKKMNKELSYAFILWKDNQQPIRISEVPLRAFRQLLNYIYIGLCETLGPVEADKILAKSVATVGEVDGLNAKEML